MAIFMHAVISTPDFVHDADNAGLSDEEVAKIIDTISSDPAAGKLMVGTGGARKIRFGRQGKRKRGGYRVVTYYGGDDIPVSLLGLFSKGEKANLSKAERNALRKELEGIAADYRVSVRKRVADMKRG